MFVWNDHQVTIVIGILVQGEVNVLRIGNDLIVVVLGGCQRTKDAAINRLLFAANVGHTPRGIKVIHCLFSVKTEYS